VEELDLGGCAAVKQLGVSIAGMPSRGGPPSWICDGGTKLSVRPKPLAPNATEVMAPPADASVMPVKTARISLDVMRGKRDGPTR
jgi:hypothetical protein